MTREMKLGLLVTLAFVIVIGVLFSDFVQQRAQPQRADLIGSSENVRKGIAGPDNKNPGTVAVVPPTDVQPVTVVPTQESISQEKAPIPEIAIGPAATPGNRPTLPAMAFGSDKTDVTPPIGGAGSGANVLPPTPNGSAGTPVGTKTPPTALAKTYTAVDGDTITKIAKKMYGTWTPAHGELILKANPSMGPEGKKIKIGGKYQIPALPGTAVPSATPAAPVTGSPAIASNTTGSAPAPTTPTPVTPAPAKGKVVASGKTYTVKDGDSLWKIASKQAGGHLNELVELNKDVLKEGGKSSLKIGTVLKLPSTQVASAD